MTQDSSLQQQKPESKQERWKRKLTERLYSVQKGPHSSSISLAGFHLGLEWKPTGRWISSKKNFFFKRTYLTIKYTMFLKTTGKYLRYDYKHGRQHHNHRPSAEASWESESIFFFLKSVSHNKSIWITTPEREMYSSKLWLRRKLGIFLSFCLPETEWWTRNLLRNMLHGTQRTWKMELGKSET